MNSTTKHSRGGSGSRITNPWEGAVSVSPVTADQVAAADAILEGSALKDVGLQSSFSGTDQGVSRGGSFSVFTGAQIRKAEEMFKGSALEAKIGSRGSPFQSTPPKSGTLRESYGSVSPVSGLQIQKAEELLSTSSLRGMTFTP